MSNFRGPTSDKTNDSITNIEIQLEEVESSNPKDNENEEAEEYTLESNED